MGKGVDCGRGGQRGNGGGGRGGHHVGPWGTVGRFRKQKHGFPVILSFRFIMNILKV